MEKERFAKIKQLDSEISDLEKQILASKSEYYTDVMDKEYELLKERYSRVKEYRELLSAMVSGADKNEEIILANAKKLMERYRQALPEIARGLKNLKNVGESIRNAIAIIPNFDVANSDDDYERRKCVELIKFDLETCEELWNMKAEDILLDLQEIQQQPLA